MGHIFTIRTSSAGLVGIILLLLLGLHSSVGLAVDTVSLPVLVNIEGFDSLTDDEKKELEDMVKRNIEDANKILEKECKDCKMILGPVKIKHNPSGSATVTKGSGDTGKLVSDGKSEVEKEFGKGKGQKIYIVEEILDGENSIDGLGADGQPVIFIPFGTLAVRPIRDKDENIIGFEGLHGHFILHELLHNAGWDDSKHTSNGSLFDGQLDTGTRAVKRTMTDDQCKKLKEYFKARGTVTKDSSSDGGGSSSNTEKTSLNDYDANSDSLLSNGEFFAMVDDWIAGVIANALFFEGIDLWISGDSPPINTPTPPSGGTPLPPSLGLTCYLGGLPQSCGSLRLNSADAAIGIGFRQQVALPDGSVITWQVTTQADGLKLEGGRAGGSLSTNETLSGAILTVIGTATQDVALSSTRPALDIFLSAQASGMIQVSGSLRLPDGTQRSFSVTLQVFEPVVMSQSVVPLQILDWATTRYALQNTLKIKALGQGIERINVVLFDLSGHLVDDQQADGTEIMIRTLDLMGRPWANGLYFYQAVAHGYDGQIIASPLRKFILMR